MKATTSLARIVERTYGGFSRILPFKPMVVLELLLSQFVNQDP